MKGDSSTHVYTSKGRGNHDRIFKWYVEWDKYLEMWAVKKGGFCHTRFPKEQHYLAEQERNTLNAQDAME